MNTYRVRIALATLLFILYTLRVQAIEPGELDAAPVPPKSPALHIEDQNRAIPKLLNLAHRAGTDVSEDAINRLWLMQHSTTDWERLIDTVKSAHLPLVVRRLRNGILSQYVPLLARFKASDEIVLVEAATENRILLSTSAESVLMSRREFERRFEGSVLSSADPGPLRIEKSIHDVDLASASGNMEIVRTISLRNASRYPLPVKVSSISCGCTGATLSPNLLRPGARGAVTVKMHATESQIVTVDIQAGDAQTPSGIRQGLIAIHASGTQVDSPPSVLLNTTRGKAVEDSVQVRLPRISKLTRVRVSEAWISAMARPVTTSAAQTKVVEIHVKLSDKAPVGRFESKIHLYLDNSTVRELVVPVTGTVNSDVTVDPPVLMLGSQSRGVEIRKTVIVRSPRPISIASIESTEHVSAKADARVKARVHAVEIVTCVYSEEDKSLGEWVKLHLSDGSSINVHIITNGTAKIPAVLNSPADISVGSRAPEIELEDQNGIVRRLNDARGQRAVLLTFFPRCFSGGCAQQLASLHREKPAFDRAGIEIWAVTTDAMAGTGGAREFMQKLKFEFPVLSDESRRVCAMYGAASSPEDLARRQTIFIDKNGIIRLIDRDIKVTTHGRDILMSLKQLNLM